LDQYLNGFVANLRKQPFSNQKVFQMANKWREDSKNLTPLKYNRFTKKPIENWYRDLFRISTNDNWLQTLEFYEKFLYKIYEHEEIDPQKAAFYRQNLTAETLDSTIGDGSASNGSYQERVNGLFGCLIGNLAINVMKILMVNNVKRVDNVVRNFNPVLLDVIIGQILSENNRDNEEVINQQKRFLARQHCTFDYELFLRSFKNYIAMMDVPFPRAECNELMAVQADFDKIAGLLNASSIEMTKMTNFNWGRELLAEREISTYLLSDGVVTSSFINDAVRWTKMRVTDGMQVFVADNFSVATKDTLNTMLDSFLIFLIFAVKKFIK
jgi:hypothetical protein